MKKTIMIVDDSQIIRSRIERNVKQVNLAVVAVASNGAEALDLYKKHKPDMVTMDLTMPQMDGLACISAICQFDAQAKILVISALSDKATGIRAIKLGAQGFLYKPFTDDELTEALEEILND
ncbi:MAG: response regulator [Cardiobacteriaceae bacterium]|nr:response regulator [Cardiobacteriaceae bacterium]